MNRIYRSAWNASRGCYVAVPEHARTKGKSSTTRTVVAMALLTLGSGQTMAQTTYTAANASYERVSAKVVTYYCDDWYSGHSVGDSTCDDDSGHWYGASNVTDNSPAIGTVTGSSIFSLALGNSAVILSNANNGAIKRTYAFTNQALFPDEVWVYVTRTATYNYASTWTANLTGNNVNVAASGGVSISTASGITSNLALTGNNTFAGSVTLTGTLSQAAGSTNFQGAVIAPTTNLTGGSVDFDSTLNTNNLTINDLSTANFDGAVTATGTVGITNSGSINFHNGLSAATFNTIQNIGTLAGNLSNTGSSTLNIQGGSGSITSNSIGIAGMRSTLPGDFGTLTGYNNTVGTIGSTGANVNLGGNLLLNDHIDASGHTVTNNGILLVSNTATPLNITGNFTNAGTYATTVDSDTGNYSRLAVSGNVALGGRAFVNVLGSGSLTAGGTFGHVITAGGVLSGAFSGIEDNSYLYNFSGLYDGTSFGLRIVAAGSGGNGGALINADAANLNWASGDVTVAGGTTVSSGTSAAALTISGGSLNNVGAIAGGSSGAGVDVTAGSTVGQLSNSGTISGHPAVRNGGTITTLSNEDGGRIDGTDTGIANSGAIGTLNNTSGSSVTGGNTGLLNQGSITTLNNDGEIAGTNNIGLNNSGGTIGTLNNTGSIDGHTSGIGNSGGGTITTLHNNSGGIISGGGYGIANSNGSINQLLNEGTIEGGTGGVFTGGAIGSLVNSGTIQGPTAIEIDSGGSIGNIANTGTIAGDIRNAGSGALNIQGASGSVSSNVIGSDGMRSILPTDFGTLTGYNNTVGTIRSTGADVNLSGNLLLNDHIDATGHTVYNSGILKIENTGTPLDITGNFTNTGTFVMTVAGDTSYSRLHVSGNATLGGGAFVNVLGAPTLTNGGTLANVIRAGTLSGAFSGIEDNSYLYNFEGVYDATSFGLKVVAAGGGGGGTVIGTDAANLNWAGGSVTVAPGVTVSSGTSSPALQASGSNLGTLSNQGTIAGSSTGAGIAVTPDAAVSQLKNTAQGTISGETGVYNAGAIGTLSNQAGGSIGGTDIGIDNDGGSITALSNGGTIHGDVTGIDTRGSIALLSNNGTISGPTAINVASGGSIASILNTSTIAGDISNGGSGNLNIQGGSGPTYGLLTGYNNTVGTIANTGSDVNFSGNLILNDHVDAGSNTVYNSGKLKVENVDTPLNITGDFTNSGTYVTSVASDSRYSKLAVSGAAEITGSTLAVNVLGTPTLTPGGTLVDVITAGGGLTGTFKTITDNSYLYNFKGGYNANSFDLTVVAANGKSTGVDDGYFSLGGGSGGSGAASGSGEEYTVAGAARINGNTPAAGAAKVLDTIVQGTGGGGADWTAVTTALGRLSTSQQVSQAASQTMPLMTGNTVAATHSVMSSVNHVIRSRIEGYRGLSSGDDFYSSGNVWIKPFGSRATQSSSDGVSGYTANNTGLVAGTDTDLSDHANVGFALAYANASVSSSSDTAPSSAKIDLFQLIGYGSYALDASQELTWQVDVGHNNNRGKRSIGFMGTNAASRYSSLTMHIGLGISWSFPLSEKTDFLPSLRADYARIKDDGYSETGASVLNLNVDGRSSAQMLWSVDGKIRHRLDNGIDLIANAGIGYDSLNQRSTLVSAFAGTPGASFATDGLSQSPWVTHAGVGVSKTLANGTAITARYDGEFRTGFNNQTASIKAKWVF